MMRLWRWYVAVWRRSLRWAERDPLAVLGDRIVAVYLPVAVLLLVALLVALLTR